MTQEPYTNDGEPASAHELMRADQILSQINKDLEIDYQLRNDEMTTADAKRNFQLRKALEIVRLAMIEKAEAILST